MGLSPQSQIGQAGQPLHENLKAIILEKIDNGVWAPRSQIASEREMCERYGVSRATTRKVLSDLTHEGVIYTVAGKGAFVAEKPLRQELRPLVGFRDDLLAKGIAPASVIRRFERIDADDILAQRLRIRSGSAVIVLERLRFAGGKAVALQNAFVPEHLCPGILRFDFASSSLYETLRDEYALALVDADTAIRPDLAEDWEAALAGRAMPLAVLRTFQTTYLDDKRPVEFCMSTFFGAGFELTVAGGAQQAAPFAGPGVAMRSIAGLQTSG